MQLCAQPNLTTFEGLWLVGLFVEDKAMRQMLHTFCNRKVNLIGVHCFEKTAESAFEGAGLSLPSHIAINGYIFVINTESCDPKPFELALNDLLDVSGIYLLSFQK